MVLTLLALLSDKNNIESHQTSRSKTTTKQTQRIYKRRLLIVSLILSAIIPLQIPIQFEGALTLYNVCKNINTSSKGMSFIIYFDEFCGHTSY